MAENQHLSSSIVLSAACFICHFPVFIYSSDMMYFFKNHNNMAKQSC